MIRALVPSATLLVASSLAAAAPVEPADALVLGPLARPSPLFTEDVDAEPAGFVPELRPAAAWPAEGDAVAWFDGAAPTWRRVAAESGALPLPGAEGRTVTYAIVYATVDRYGDADVVVDAPGDVRLFVDGEEAAHGGTADAAATTLSHRRSFRRGTHRLLARVERGGGSTAGAARLRLEPDRAGGDAEGDAEGDEAVWTTSAAPRHPPAAYDELREVARIGGLLLSPDGALLAVRRSERGPGGTAWSRLDLLRVADGAVVAASLGGSDARAVQWRRDGEALLLRAGGDLLVWDRDTREVTRVLEDEPGLGAVHWSPDGRELAFVSTRGVEEPGAGGIVRRTELRERLSDWPTRPHLWHLVLASGARRRLAEPGDRVQDGFAFLGDGRLVVLRNGPIDARPWFDTHVRTIGLRSGAETPVASLRMGFENRPGLSGFAASPDGTRIAFVGPPSELGDDVAVEPNAFDPDLHVLDVATGTWTNATADLKLAVDGHLRWAPDSSAVRFLATAGARSELVTLALDGVAVVAVERASAGGERVHDVDFAGETFAAVVSDTDRLPRLVANGRELLAPNRDLEARWALSSPEDRSFVAEDGTAIEAWLHRPAPAARPDGKLPLVVYYYGGASPSRRGWNELHAFLVANGYALYVLNPRGASGYGAAFANHHVNDWGEKAGADVLRGVEDVLARDEDLDPARVGCFGGSYGGFMTMWLLTRTDRFAAGVSLYGISNLASYWGDGMWGWTYGDQAMARSTPWSRPDWYVEHSPLYHADRITTPLLLLHGGEDANVPPAESEQMFTALRLLKRPVELVRFAGEDHGLRGTWENRVAHREMMVDWFDRYLRGWPEAWEERWE